MKPLSQVLAGVFALVWLEHTFLDLSLPLTVLLVLRTLLSEVISRLSEPLSLMGICLP